MEVHRTSSELLKYNRLLKKRLELKEKLRKLDKEIKEYEKSLRRH